MKKMHVFGMVILTVLALSSLVACGGGGGGGGFTPIAYSGSTAQATIDGSNAEDFAALAESGANMSGAAPIPMAVSSGGDAGADIPVPVISTVTELNKMLPAYLGKTTVDKSVAAATQTESYYCGIGDGSDGSMTISATLGSAGNVSATVRYIDCDEGFGVVMNGVVAFSMSDIYADPYVTPVTFTITYRNLEMHFVDTMETITIYAAMSMTEDLTGVDPVYTNTISDMIMQDSATGLTARISNYKIVVTERYDAVAGRYYDEITIASASVKARVYDHELGYIEFYTVTPIKEDYTGPYEGIVHMDGANGTWAEVDFSVTCDAVTNNGTYFDGTVTGEFCYIPSSF